jgi:thioredoxin-dependent peroxiredoxin
VIGDIAEDFTLKDQSGKSFNLYDNLSKKILLIFYPKDDSLVCTKQLSNYQKDKNEFLNLGIILVGINADSEESHLNFTNKCNLDFPILTDPNKEVCRKYKAVDLFGKIKRKLVLVSENRKILFEDEVLSFRYRTSGKLKVLFVNLQ